MSFITGEGREGASGTVFGRGTRSGAQHSGGQFERMQVNKELQMGSSSVISYDGDVCLEPGGDRGIKARQVIFGTSTVLDNRGITSVDLQLNHAAADQVAAGVGSGLFAGANNKVTDTGVSLGGFSVIMGGVNSTIDGANRTAIAGGDGHTIASGCVSSFIGGGTTHSFSGVSGGIIGGNAHTHTGFRSVALGGSSVTTTGTDSITLAAGGGGTTHDSSLAAGISAASFGVGTAELRYAGGIRLTTSAQTEIDGATFNGGTINTTTTNLTTANSGTYFNIVQAGAIRTVNLPAPAAGLNYHFVLTTAAAANVNIVATGAFMNGNITDASAGNVTAIPGHTTLSFVGGTAAVGDTVEFQGITTTIWRVVAVSSANGGITTA